MVCGGVSGGGSYTRVIDADWCTPRQNSHNMKEEYESTWKVIHINLPFIVAVAIALSTYTVARSSDHIHSLGGTSSLLRKPRRSRESVRLKAGRLRRHWTTEC